MKFSVFLILIGFIGIVTIPAYAESLFDYVVEPVIIGDGNWIIHEPLDWSPDGNSILFRVWIPHDSEIQDTSLVLIGPDGTVQKELQLGLQITGVDHARITPTNDMVHILDNGKIYRYVLETDEIVLLNTEGNNARFFDYYRYSEDDPLLYNIVYSVENLEPDSDDPNSQYDLLAMHEEFGRDSSTAPSELLSSLETPNFQFSPDGKKILFAKTLEVEEGLKYRVPAYVEAQDYGPHIIPNAELNCSNNLKWSPNGEMVVYQDKMCGRCVHSGFLGLVSLDGYNKRLIPKEDSASYPRTFVISPDGSTIVYVVNAITSNEPIQPSTIESAVVYKLTLAKPIPEFETITMMILVLSVLPIVLLRKQMMLK